MTDETATSDSNSGRVAFAALQELARQTRQHARGLPAQVDIKPHWSGIGFELLGHRFVAPMGEVSEMLEVPVYTRLPGVQSWVRGVANVRGRLLPLCDLAEFLGGRIQGSRKQQRVLILEADDLYTGLLVDRVLGMQHFPVDTYDSSAQLQHQPIASFVDGCYRQAGREWIVFSPHRLLQDVHFMNAGEIGV